MDLVQVEVAAEQGPALVQLAGQGGQGVVLDLVDVGVHAPVADVGVAPLGADGDLGRVEPLAWSQLARNASARP